MSLSKILRLYPAAFLFTFLLILLDAGLLLLFPLFIGRAIDGALVQDFEGLMHLGLLGIASLLAGAMRRFFDSRFYAKVYQQLGAGVSDRVDVSAGAKSARLGFITEVVEFFENILPQLVNNCIGLVGTLIIIASFDGVLLGGCLLVLLLTVLVYGISGQRITLFNREYDQELEKQVSVISEHQPIMVRRHLKKLMHWNIKLSDLETLNFSLIWLLMMGLLLGGIAWAVQQGMNEFGVLFSLVLYLFQFIESGTEMPLYYQQWLRLKGILKRLGSGQSASIQSTLQR